MPNPANGNELGIAVLTGAGTRIVSPLLQDACNIVGIAELKDGYCSQPCYLRFLTNCYWLCFRFKRPPCLFLISKSLRIPYLNMENRIDDRLATWLRKLEPDVLVVYQAPLLPQDIFTIPTYGTINIHPSLLPKYRGAHPIMWMHLNMDQEGGVTIHRVDAGMDSGEILAQAEFHIPLGAHECETEHMAIDKFGVPLLKEVLRKMETGVMSGQAQTDVAFSGEYKRLSPQEYRSLLDWDKWDIKHMWHVLRCTDHWKAIYLPDELKRRSRVWGIGDIEYACNSLPHGGLAQDTKGYYLSHRDGKIRLIYKTSFKRYFKTCLKCAGNHRLYSKMNLQGIRVLVALLLMSTMFVLTLSD